MKKVLLLAAAALLFAAPSFAAIANTAHDLSSGSSASIKGNSSEICVYCHTPHGAGAAGFAPLWNRTTINATAVYGNGAGTINATLPTLAEINATDAVLCLSCHDGTSLGSTLTNPPNGTGQPTITGTMSTNANIGTDLSNDHPVGFVYSTSSADTEIVANAGGLPLYGTSSDTMWCSSCHDVHDNTNAPFLLSTNVGSALCLKCHKK